ncbi:SDR family NAD(P)-dependent oxidoreductase [Nocardia transvalensis]|uniref:SDR family NAD(P)-dependent oxidoreductase n=1 Tax=Nocardia transvalensis TaxID=37333 RepID=UPI0018960ADB|nr:SDR family oxidoreductase [Nocardia transvalensis]MBF6331135.1 SDR family oxidoreductase [Nocardia transvalensis]
MTTSAAPLAGQHAVVTGGGRGIGAAIARRLARDGARITLFGRAADTLTATAAELPGPAASFVCDVTDAAAVSAAFAMARAEHGTIDILVNNAGRAASAPLTHTDDALWHDMLAVNLTGAFLCTRAALTDMLDRDSGRIVTIASTAGQRGYRYACAYAAAKHGVIGLTRALALEVAATGITVNAVCPGFTDTDLLHDNVTIVADRTGRDRDAALDAFVRYNPQGRLIEPDEVADTVAWLCSPDAKSITGQSISISGGEVT